MSKANPYVCRQCGKSFSSLSLFDWHRTGSFTEDHPHYGRSCRSDLELLMHRAVLSEGTWVAHVTEAQRASLQRLRASSKG